MSAKPVSGQSVKGHDARPKHDAWGFFGRQGVTDQPVTYRNLTEWFLCGTLRPLTDRMKKSARASAPESQRSQWLERLTDAVNRLADEVRVVRDVLDETREDLGWLTRNGIPGRHGEHRQIVRMACDPLASNANELLEVITSTGASANSSELAPDVFDELVSEIAEAVTVVGQEQVNLLLSALDDVRAKLLAAIKASPKQPKVEKQPTSPLSAPHSDSVPSPKPSEPRSLF